MGVNPHKQKANPVDALSISRHTLPRESHPLSDDSDDELPMDVESMSYTKPGMESMSYTKSGMESMSYPKSGMESMNYPKSTMESYNHPKSGTESYSRPKPDINPINNSTPNTHHTIPNFNTAPIEKQPLENTQTPPLRQSYTAPKPPLPRPLSETPKLHPPTESSSSHGCRLFVWGTNHTHQLGLPSIPNAATPTQLSLPAIQHIAAGGSHALAATPAGEIFAWGNGDKGQLGLGESVTSAPSPRVALELAGCVSVSAGGGHSLAVGGDGRVFAWGNGIYGQLGLGLECEGCASPREVEKLRGKAICKVVENGAYFRRSAAVRITRYFWREQAACMRAATVITDNWGCSRMWTT